MGSHLADGLLDKGYQVRIFDKRNVDTHNINHIIDQVDLVKGDFTNELDIEAALKGVDYIFHFICTTIPQTSTDNPVYDIETNVVSTVKMLEIAVKEKVKKVIFSSSGGTVYGIPQKLPISENHPTNPNCAYGISKLIIEKYLHLFFQVYNLPYVILRFSNPFGERQNPLSEQGSIAVFLGLVKEKKPIYVWGDGSVVRDYIYIQDLVAAPIKAIEIESGENLFNIGSGKGTSLNELLNTIRQVTGNNLAVNYTQGRSIDVPANILDISRAKKALRFIPAVSLKEGIEKAWGWINR